MSDDLEEIYNKRVLELASNIPLQGRLEKPDSSASVYSKLCGSNVTVDLIFDDGIVVDFAHDVKACALGQATSSIMARNIVGSSMQELREVRDLAHSILKEGVSAPNSGKWVDLQLLEPVREYKNRHTSTLLTFDAVVEAINKIYYNNDLNKKCG